jgi:membrane protein required for beta-lactamase induction
MAKLTAWLVTLVGLLLVLNLLLPGFSGVWFNWVVALAVLVVGVGKLMRNYNKKKRK